MNKLEIGMYVRTKDGIITKVDYIDDETIYFDKDIYRIYSAGIDFLEKDNLERIKKASFDIKDLIEAGDIVVNESNNKQEVLLIDNELMVKNTGLIYDNNYYLPIKSIAIKSILTKEQFESRSYRIGDDK